MEALINDRWKDGTTPTMETLNMQQFTDISLNEGLIGYVLVANKVLT